MYLIEFSGPYSAPADKDFTWHWCVSPCCGHIVRTWEDGAAGLPRGQLIGVLESCEECAESRRLKLARGVGAVEYLAEVVRLGLPSRSDGFDERDFWAVWVTAGRVAALADAAAAGYSGTVVH